MNHTDFSIENLDAQREGRIAQTADLLYSVSKVFFPDAWPTAESALEEVRESLTPERISLVAISSGSVVGWIGGIPQYDGHVYELHPLVVRIEFQRRGIGSALISALEHEVALRGGITLWLGSDDESGKTSISGKDLYPDVLGQLQSIKNIHGHPYEFYMKNGFTLVGVLPDANGYGKPDIYLAKRINRHA